MERSLARSYAVLTPLLSIFFVSLYMLVARSAGVAAEPEALIAPVVALVGLTAVVFVLMLLARNVSVIRGTATIAYYQAYRPADAPDERIERATRTFMNLLEVPVLFYVVCILMLVTRQCDAAQVQLAWAFVGMRVLHAVIYIGINYVPARLGAYLAGCVTLAVIWSRFATQAL